MSDIAIVMEPALPRATVGILASQGGESGGKTTVRARRRRPKGRSTPESRQRAGAPRRRRGKSTGGAPQPSGRPPSGGGGLPMGRMPRMSCLGVVLLAVVAICLFAAFALLGPSESGDDYAYDAPAQAGELAPPTAVPPTRALPTSVPPTFVSPTTAPQASEAQSVIPEAPSSGGDQTWLVMLYQDADDKILERDIYVDLNEAERVGSRENLHIVAQMDRYKGGYRADGDWTSAKRFYLTYDSELEAVRSQQVADLGEVNMANGETLVDFVTWAVETYPADKHVLIMSDHGMGWPGGWTDPAPGGRGDHDVALAEMGDELFLMELDDALQEIRDRTGLEQFELIGLDACLMGHLEVYSALEPHARYAVASQETEPALGWAYVGFLQHLQENPGMNGADLGHLIVQSYIREDQRIVDDEARAGFVGQGSSLGWLFGGPTAAQVAQQLEDDITLAAIDLDAVPALNESLNSLAYALMGVRQQGVAAARTYAQAFTSVFGKKVPPSYLDLGHFAQLVKRESNDAAVAEAADQVLAMLDQAVIAEKHGRKKPGASGVSFYFPNSQLYRSRYAGPESYTTVARRFAQESLWDEFLAYHYTGRSFEPDTRAAAVPDAGVPVRGPGAGAIEVEPITLSSNVAAPGQSVLLSTEIRGENVGYIYLFVGYHDPALNSIFIADRDYLQSGQTREIGGVYYPDWGNSGELVLEFEWEPIVYAVNDGARRALAVFSPEDYGAVPEEAVYTVEGVYTFTDGSGSRYARLYFSDGELGQVYGYTGQDGMGAPREIIPESGDSFTVLEQWMDLVPGGAAEFATQEGNAVVFGDEVMAWEELDAPAGEYVVGFIVEDLDGNAYPVYKAVRVAE